MTRASGAALVAALVACGGAYLTAPSGSTITLLANPDRIPAHGGVAELTAIVTEPAGTDVPNGTVVLWTTTLGRIDRETRTVNGIARNRLVSDSRSGTATVVASSGGEAIPPPSPTPSPSPTASPSPATRPGGPTALGSGSAVAMGAVRNSATIDITIGNVLVANVLLRANPPRITNSNSTHVIATVLDQFGNPVPNVPVFFEVVTDQDTDFFEAAGPIHTDNNGEAEAVLRTRRQFQGTIVVRARAAAGTGFKLSDNLSIQVL